jgi:hypothetical protein
MRRISATVCVALLCFGCAHRAPRVGPAAEAPILTESDRVSHWPVEGETRPGLWIRFEALASPIPMDALIDGLQIEIEHGDRKQVVTGAAFSPMAGAGDGRQTRYLYTPASGVLFVTLKLRTAGHTYFPDTQRIELNGDC